MSLINDHCLGTNPPPKFPSKSVERLANELARIRSFEVFTQDARQIFRLGDAAPCWVMKLDVLPAVFRVVKLHGASKKERYTNQNFSMEPEKWCFVYIDHFFLF